MTSQARKQDSTESDCSASQHWRIQLTKSETSWIRVIMMKMWMMMMLMMMEFMMMMVMIASKQQRPGASLFYSYIPVGNFRHLASPALMLGPYKAL